MSLLEKRNKIVKWHKTLESVPGSGFHEKTPAWKAALDAGELPLSERPIAFKIEHDIAGDAIAVVGPCVAKVYTGLKTFAKKATDDPAFKSQVANEFMLRQTLELVTKTLAKPQPKEIVVNTQNWNLMLYALSLVGIQCVLADGVTPDDED